MSSIRRREEQHNTSEQVVGYLREAYKAVESASLPTELREPAFLKAVDLLASKQIFSEQAPPLGVPAMAIPRGKLS